MKPDVVQASIPRAILFAWGYIFVALIMYNKHDTMPTHWFYISEVLFMSTVQAFQGYFLADGRFVTDSPRVSLPTMRRAIVNILTEDIIELEEKKDDMRIAQLNKILGSSPV